MMTRGLNISPHKSQVCSLTLFFSTEKTALQLEQLPSEKKINGVVKNKIKCICSELRCETIDYSLITEV